MRPAPPGVRARRPERHTFTKLEDAAVAGGARVLRVPRQSRADRHHTALPLPVGVGGGGLDRAGRGPASTGACCPVGCCRTGCSRAMRITHDASAEEEPGTSYGLGLERFTTPCGAAWGHAGNFAGYIVYAYSSADGSRQTVLLPSTRTRPPCPTSRARLLRAAERGLLRLAGDEQRTSVTTNEGHPRQVRPARVLVPRIGMDRRQDADGARARRSRRSSSPPTTTPSGTGPSSVTRRRSRSTTRPVTVRIWRWIPLSDYTPYYETGGTTTNGTFGINGRVYAGFGPYLLTRRLVGSTLHARSTLQSLHGHCRP